MQALGPRFTRLLAVTGLSNLADGMLVVGVPLLAVTLTGSPAGVSLLSAAATVPWLVLALGAGVVVDRHDQIRILTIATAVRAMIVTVGAAAVLTDALTLPLLFALVLALGAAEVFADSAATALVPAVVPRARLGAANSRVLGIQQLAQSFLGGPLAGALIALSTASVLGVPAALYAAGAVVALRAGRTRSGPVGPGGAATAPGSAPKPAPRPGAWAELRGGVRYLRGHRVVWPLVLAASAANLASAAYFAVFVLWVVGPRSAVGIEASSYGLLLVPLAVGALTGAATAQRLLARTVETRLLFGCWLTGGLLLALPVVVPRPGVVAGALGAIGFTTMVGNVVSQSIRQRLVPGSMLGRVGGASRTLSYGCMTLGAVLGGVVGEAAGLPAVFIGASLLTAAAAVWVARRVPQPVLDAADAALDEPGRPHGDPADQGAGPAGRPHPAPSHIRIHDTREPEAS